MPLLIRYMYIIYIEFEVYIYVCMYFNTLSLIFFSINVENVRENVAKHSEIGSENSDIFA